MYELIVSVLRSELLLLLGLAVLALALYVFGQSHLSPIVISPFEFLILATFALGMPIVFDSIVLVDRALGNTNTLKFVAMSRIGRMLVALTFGYLSLVMLRRVRNARER